MVQPPTQPVTVVSLAGRAAAGLLVALATVQSAGAAPLRFDFEDATGFVVTSNYLSNGFRFSPNCHRDHPTSDSTGVWFGWDSSGCSLGPVGAVPSYNLEWLGPAALVPTSSSSLTPAYTYVDRTGDVFSLLSLDVVNISSLMFLSSKGGVLNGPGMPTGGTLNFEGPAWTDIQWLLIGPVTAGFPVGIDNVVVDVRAVAAPATTSLVLAALGLLVATRRAAWPATRPKQAL